MSKSYQYYLNLDTSQYEEGEYLVMIDDRVIRHGKELKTMLDDVRKQYPDKVPFIAKVPAEGVMVLACWECIDDRI